MSKRGQNTTSNDGSPKAKARPVNLVMRSQSKEETSSSSFGSRVNPVNDDERKRVGQAPGNWMRGDSKSEVENSQVSRQEKVLHADRKMGQKGQTQIKSEENPPGTRKLAACSPDRYMGKIFQCLDKKLGMSAINATFPMYAYNSKVLTWRLFFSFVDLGPDVLTGFGNLQEHKIREYLECIQHHSEVDKGTFWRISECGMPGIFITMSRGRRLASCRIL